MNPELLERYAEVIVRIGCNLQPGQPLFVNTGVEHVPLARAVAEAGWQAGAADVQLHYVDAYERMLLAKHGDDEHLTRTSGGELGLRLAELDARGAAVSIRGDTSPPFFEQADEQRLARTSPREARAIVNRLMNEQLQTWVVVAYPDETWAERIFGTPDVDRLTEEIALACRLHEPDPVAAWSAHLDRLWERRALLQERSFDRLHVRGPGTDLTVGLIPGASWLGGYSETYWGQRFCANIPTEEVYTTPHRLRTEGTVSGTRAVSYREGVVVDGIRLRFEAGRVVEASASRGEEFLLRHLETDAGASYLGEVALVAGSPIGARGLLFTNTLYDENATSHIAYGMGYTEPLAKTAGTDRGALGELGVNDSAVHTDFPIGGDGVEIDGVDGAGGRVPILAGDTWLLR